MKVDFNAEQLLENSRCWRPMRSIRMQVKNAGCAAPIKNLCEIAFFRRATPGSGRANRSGSLFRGWR